VVLLPAAPSQAQVSLQAAASVQALVRVRASTVRDLPVHPAAVRVLARR
jgi:hypothetical protein